MQKFWCLLFVLKLSYIPYYYIICMTVPLPLKFYNSFKERFDFIYLSVSSIQHTVDSTDSELKHYEVTRVNAEQIY